MLLAEKKVKRLGIFVFFDKYNKVDKYVEYLLSDFRKAVDKLIIVSNSKLSEKEYKKLESFSDILHIRKNEGLDAGAIKFIYDLYYDKWKSYDEVLILNDTFFGPFTTFKDICAKMAKKDIDFWGLTANYDSEDGYGFLEDKMIHQHIQTFFLAFRKNVVNSKAFKKYWDNYDVGNRKTFLEVVTKHELSFTHYLEKAGFKWDVYVDLTEFKEKDRENNYNIYAYSSYDLIRYYNCPFIKRKNFVFDKIDALYLTDGGDARRSLDYIEKSKIYDTSLIINNLLIQYNNEDLYKGLNLHYIISDESTAKGKSFVVLLMINHEKNVGFIKRLLGQSNIKNIVIYTSDKSIAKAFSQSKYPVITNQKDFDYSKYDFVGIWKDTNFSCSEMSVVRNNYLLNSYNNLFESEEYVNNLLELFIKKSYLGIICHPSDLQKDLFGEYGLNSNEVPISNNACFIHSESFDWNTIMEYSFVNAYKKEMNSQKKLFITVQNIKEAQNRFVVDEFIIKETYKTIRRTSSRDIKSFPEGLMLIPFIRSIGTRPNIIRRILSKIKRIIKKVLKIK